MVCDYHTLIFGKRLLNNQELTDKSGDIKALLFCLV